VWLKTNCMTSSRLFWKTSRSVLPTWGNVMSPAGLGCPPRNSDNVTSFTALAWSTIRARRSGSLACGITLNTAETKSPVASNSRSTPSIGSPPYPSVRAE